MADRPHLTALRIGIYALVLAGILCLYALVPRRGHLRQFDPSHVARAETDMWRDYYEHRYARLFLQLYALSRDDYGFSPADSLAMAWYAARAAHSFQPTRSRAEAQVALPDLLSYYSVLRRNGGETFDVVEAARLELDWWQLRRENVDADRYGLVIARVTSAIFHADGPGIRSAGLLRAGAMHYRDERGRSDMREGDWSHIQAQLTRSYQALHAAIQ